MFTEPGYYRVLAHITASSATPVDMADTTVLNQSDRTLWILVDEKGGQLTEGWDSLALAGRQPKFGAYGPFVSEASVTPSASSQTSALLADYTYSGRVTYLNRPISRRDPVPGMSVSVGCGHIVFWSPLPVYDTIAHVTTNATGNWSASCPSDHPYGQILAFLSNTYADVQGEGGDFAGVLVNDQNGGSFPDMRVANDDAAKAYLVLTQRVPQVFSKFLASRSAIEVWVKQQDTTDYWPRYQSGPDHIRTNFLSVFGPDGTWITMHEYGHAFHWKAIEPPAANECPEPHRVGSPSSLSCAFTEGFADFFGAWIAGDSLVAAPSGFTDFNFETNNYRDNGDGAVIEGAVAGFFYDLVDGTVERDNSTNTGKLTTESSWDTATFPAWYLRQVMSTCHLQSQTLPPFVVDELDGIDQFIYCAERSLGAQSLTQYFPARLQTYYTFSESAAEGTWWSASTIRKLWLYNLYNVAP